MSATLIAGRYRVEGSLGRGGVGEVLRVLDVERGTRLALKRLPAIALPKVHAQFEFEFRTLASLRHPRIVRAHEFGRDEAGAFYTMELLTGDDLARRTPLPWREVCGLLRDAAEGLGVLHGRGLVHRDISVRNLWRTPDGRVKLIDLGTLAPFGPSSNLVGTPPCVPPEALERQPLDARADFYALGAVAYFLLTGLNAFPARTIAQLEELWKQEPRPPSHAIAELGRMDLPPIPDELDALVAELLSRSPLGRPASTAQLLDRLDHLLGEGSSPSHELAEAQLAHPAFVGRTRERRRLRRLYMLAARGRGQCVVVAGEPGQGRTRLLRELELELGTSAATVVYVDAASQQGSFATATALAGQLLDVQPTAARAALRPHAAVLAQVSPRLRERLGLSAPRAIESGVRMRAQMGLRDWLLALASTHPLVLLLDGLERSDEESLSFLVSLALELRGSSLLLVCSLPEQGTRPLEHALARASHRLTLSPFATSETLELLRSVFGSDDRVPRLAERLDEIARGNPGHLLELCRQLVRRNQVR
ncbi:MAG TPA: AAA family ATPase, partial [Polyangiales bacterium]|nr:AAA family ATPase [Polyangiales bacterium]